MMVANQRSPGRGKVVIQGHLSHDHMSLVFPLSEPTVSVSICHQGFVNRNAAGNSRSLSGEGGQTSCDRFVITW